MKQYKEMKSQYADMVLFFRLGDFYEMFDEDAKEVSALLNLTLTHRGDSPMCGIPFHAAKNYIKRLLDCGKKIAICEQLELSENSKSLAKREVVRIVTPATVVDEDFLDDKSFNYIICFFQHALAFCDVSTGDFHIRALDSKNRAQAVRSALQQIAPREILVCEDEYFLDFDFKAAIDAYPAMVTKLAPWYFSQKGCYKMLCEQAKVKSLAAYGLKDNDKLVCPAGALIRYITETSKSSVSHLTDYKVDDEESFVGMDESSRKNLELFSNLYDGSSRYSLFDSINRTRTSGGSRLLKNWISFPLRELDKIEFRQQWVRYFVDSPSELSRVREALTGAMDLSRLLTRVLLKRAVPHDLVGIKQTIGSFFSLVSANPDKYFSLLEKALDQDALSSCAALMQRIDKAINEQCLGQFQEGQVILDGYDELLDERRALRDHSDEILKRYLDKVKAESGITILKLGYNRVFGYYLEVPKGQASRVPDYFYRKQTLVNGERFTTEELMQYEKDILQANAQAETLERQLYDEILAEVLKIDSYLMAIGHFLNTIDVFQSLATLAVDSSYVCPEMTLEDILEIKDGRHPVVEKQLPPGGFVVNGLDMSVRFALITGPNMAGKSTYLRQNALIILLAHVGSFVPASSARIGIVDKIFCRVGATDNLARGESTFLVEMQEAAFILRNCTRQSFVIVDEVGRGTSTQDGMSIAYAMMKSLIEKGAKTLFATHYHELTMLDTSGIRLLTLDVKEEKGSITFLRKVKEGVANSSYGIHVAKMAGVPAPVIKDARTFQTRHFADYTMNQGSLFTSDIGFEEPEAESSALVNALKDINLDECTPMQALIHLSKLKEMAETDN
ncbi:MAG: DNA mismatch repair protein MutS, partial [Spirochaetales bacterium]|nr:DNA mismatch repair protein MutS [Spirochaetales bacterium]